MPKENNKKKLKRISCKDNKSNNNKELKGNNKNNKD